MVRGKFFSFHCYLRLLSVHTLNLLQYLRYISSVTGCRNLCNDLLIRIVFIRYGYIIPGKFCLYQIVLRNLRSFFVCSLLIIPVQFYLADCLIALNYCDNIISNRIFYIFRFACRTNAIPADARYNRIFRIQCQDFYLYRTTVSIDILIVKYICRIFVIIFIIS